MEDEKSEIEFLRELCEAFKNIAEEESLKERIKRKNKRNQVVLTFDKFTDIAQDIISELHDEGLSLAHCFCVSEGFGRMSKKLFKDNWED